MKIKQKYIDNPDLLSDELERLMGHYAATGMRAQDMEGHENFQHWSEGCSDGLNKAYKLIFVEWEDEESVKS